MEFFKIWQTRGGVIGVNRMSLGDLIGVNIMVVAVYFILLALFVQLLPIIMLGLYVILLLNNRFGADTEFDTRQRLMVNILTIISVIYFLLDFHFGWFSFYIFSSVISEETFDSIAIFNVTIGLISVVLFFLGHEAYKQTSTMLIRLGIFVLFLFVGFKFGSPISQYFVTNVVTQYNDAELTKLREDMKINDEQNGDEERELREDKRKNEEAQKEQEMRDFDKEYANKYLN